MRFEVGKYYQHSNGQVMHILCPVNTFFYGPSLLAEGTGGELTPVGKDEQAAENWHEVSGWPRSTYTGNGIPEPHEWWHCGICGDSVLLHPADVKAGCRVEGCSNHGFPLVEGKSRKSVTYNAESDSFFLYNASEVTPPGRID